MNHIKTLALKIKECYDRGLSGFDTPTLNALVELGDRADEIIAMCDKLEPPVTITAVVNEMATGAYGTFAANLADTWFAADSSNRALIQTAWAGLFGKVRSQLESQ